MMRVMSLFLALAMIAGAGGCVRTETSSTVMNDGTGSISMKMTYKVEAIEMMRAQIEMAIDQLDGGEEAQGALDQLDQLDNMFDAKKIAAKLKEQGLEVTKAELVEKEGWKGMEIQATFSDVNAWIAKAQKAAEASKKDSDSPLSIMNGEQPLLIQGFYKTADPAIGQVVLLKKPDLSKMSAGPLGGLDELEDMDDQMREMMEMQFDMMKSMFSVDQMTQSMKVTVPGPIVETVGCKKDGENAIVFKMSGADMTVDNLQNAFGLKEGVSATFRIPEGCKIQFQDPPKKDEQKPPAEGEEKDTKKGGVKIGEDG